MSLPAAWVDALFTRLTVRYGEAFQRQYQGLDIAMVKADWADLLAGFANRPDAIAYGLEQLGEWPPHALRFKALCLPALDESRQPLKALPAPAVDREKAAAALALARDALKRPSDDPRAWARALRTREQNGDRLTLAQREMWRTALPGVEAEAV